MSLSWFNQPLEITREKTIMAARMSIGVVISFVITTYFTIVDPTWVYISLFVVLSEQKTMGASLIRGSMRAIATISSAVYSLVIILLFHNDYRANLLGFILGTFLYTYLFLGTKRGYIGTLGSITLAICLINFNDFSYVFIRPTNVLIGILIGLFSLRFFLPRRATKMLILETQNFLTEYADLSYYLANMNNVTTDLHERLKSLEANVMTSCIPRFQTLLSEAEVELNSHSEFIKIVSEMSMSLRHIVRYFASIIASMLWEGVKIDEDDKKTLLFLADAFTKLDDNLAQLSSKHQFIVSSTLVTIDGQKMVPLMLRLITLECGALEENINQLMQMLDTVKLE